MNDSNFNKSIIKFKDRYTKMNRNQNSSLLSCYGKTFLDARKRGKIKVQPAAVSRRISKNGSRQKQDTNRKRKLEFPNRKISTKRDHNIGKIIKLNVPPAKKSGRTMISSTTYPARKEKVSYLKKEKNQ